MIAKNSIKSSAMMMKQRLADNISLVAQSPDLVMEAVDVVITVPTFRRPAHLMRTLESLAQQVTARRIAIIVMENDAEGREGALAAAPRFEDGTFNGLVIVAHDRGNCNAYNAGWFTAFTLFAAMRHLCVIDDDEIAGPGWVENLCATAEAHRCDLVGGPQRPVFEGSVNEAWKHHPVFRPHHDRTGPVDSLYSSGNLAISRDVLATMPQPWLDLSFNFTGGGDADFLRRSIDRGFRAAWCEEAPVHETVPASRVTRDWIVKRSMRNGQLSAAIEHRRRAGQPLGAARTVLHSLALAAVAPARSAIRLAATGSLLNALYPVHVALGRVLSEFGYANEQYRNPKD